MSNIKYIGADVHSTTCFFSVLNQDNTVWCKKRINTTEGDITCFLQTIPGKKVITFEETNLSRWMYQLIKPHVDKVIVCNPGRNTFTKSGPKTDGIDATHLAHLLLSGYLHPVYHGDDPREHFRDLVSGYKDLIQDLVRQKNRYKALYRGDGIKLPKGKRAYKEGSPKQLSQDKAFVSCQVKDRIEHIESQREDCLKKMKKRSDSFKEKKILLSIPGIGEIHAATIIAAMVTPWRFSNKYKLWSYAGLVKHNLLSDGTSYGKRRAQGNRTLKSVYRTAGHAVLRSKKSGLRAYYDYLRKEKNKGHYEAYNAICREVASLTRSLWKKGVKYQDRTYRKAKNL